MRICDVPDCGLKHMCKGYCRKHYQRFWKYGDPAVTLSRPRATPTCTVDDCQRETIAKGLCPKHYQRYRKHGDPNVILIGEGKPKPEAPPPPGWHFQGIWPINGADTKPTEDETRELIELAIAHIPRMAARAGARLEGKAQFAVAEGRHYPGSQGAPWVLIARVPATPAPARSYHRKAS